MKLSPLWTALVAAAVSATIACSGSVEEGAAPGALPDPTTASIVEQGDERGTAAEGEDKTPPSAATAAPSEPAAPSDPAVSAGELLADEAARQVAAMKVTAYEHTTSVDESSGTYKYDCSGFLGYALSRALPTQLAAVKTFAGSTRPLAKHYQQFFASIAPGATKAGWSRVARAIDMRTGDVVAWLTPADLDSTNTGHVMIVTGAPTVNPKRANEIIIPITDSTSSFHGPSDSRYPSADGLGNGSIGVIVDDKGAPVSYRWTGGYSTKEYSTAISFARPS